MADGHLTTAIAPQKLYTKTRARIDTIMVSDREPVGKNKIIAILENSAKNRDVLLLKTITDTLSLNQDNVFFPFQELPILFLGELDSYYSDFETAYYTYIINRDLKPYSYKLVTNKSSLFHLKSQLNNLLHQKEIHTKELAYIQKDLNRQKTLLEKGVISQQDYENKELVYFSELKDFENTKFLISELKESIEQTSGDNNNLEFLRQRENTKLLKQLIQAFNQLKIQINDWELKYVLRSNSVGVVSYLRRWDTNQTVDKDELLFTISSQNITHYVAKLQTPKSNSGKIKIGQQVNFSLNDYPDYEFGVLRGQVLSITNTSNISGIYQVDVKIPKTLKTSFGKQIHFKQDMQGTADIITEDLTVLQRLFYHFRHLFNH